ncbi:extensin [Brachypodium distachyon]|uniref:C2 domain-containing protein n=1 Tax=Brachypodium distachyon TaxID=15368 RepID=I1ILD1_BRADI|nr:extensin [Brachypodium distachyon]KQJ88328.1 hypothetical protein BRADI_4g17080v3 [Brachypodium distachyon]|eukprot:XP_003576007.1 extensin [Brachypodium distachyon]
MADAGGGAGRRITVRSVSCRGVKSFVPFQKPPLYAAVSHGGRREKTPADPDGGENADWDGAVFAFDLDGRDDDGLLRFEVKAQVPLLGTKLVGSACVPVADLAGAGAPRRASYQLLAPDGKPNGSLSFVCSVTDAPAVGYQQQPQIYAARPEQDLNNSCCAPPPPPPSSWAPYPAPGMPNAAPHGSGYPPSAPPASAPLYPPLQDFLPSSYPPPPPRPTTDPLFPAPNFGSHSSYPRPPTVYPPPPASCTACPAPPAQYISSSYPPPPPSYYPPPPPSGYPPPARMNPEYPASTFPPTACSYPPPAPQPQPEFCSECPPSPAPRSVDRALHYMAPSSQGSAITHPELAVPQLPSGGSYYPPPGTRHREEEARPPYYYPPPGTRHREEEAKPPYYYPPPGTRYS